MSPLIPVFTVLSILVAAMAAVMQHALTECSRGRLEELAAKSKKGASPQRVERILQDVSGHHVAIGVWRVAATFVFMLTATYWSDSAFPVPEGGEVARMLSPGGVAMLVSLLGLFWVATMALPASIADHAAERAVLSMSRFLRLSHAVFTPARGLVRGLDEGVRRLAGPDDQTPAEQLEQEILDVVEEHGLGEEIGEEERDMLEKVVEFRSTTVEQVMTPRTDIQALEYSDDLENIKSAIIEHGHSRVPVYNHNLDTVLGLLYAKDLLHWTIAHSGNGAPFVLADILRPAIYVPETKTVRELLTELLAQRVHVAMVADEYGGTSGLVTIEDIVEEIFGEIADEYDNPDESSPGVELDVPNNAAYIDARADIDDANDLMEILDIELPESDAYDTVGGFVVVALGRIPQTGDTFEHLTEESRVQIEVLEAEPTRVKRIRATRLDPDETTFEDEPPSAPGPDAPSPLTEREAS